LAACYRIEGSAVKWAGLGCKGYRLPTEGEWEYAARAGQGTIYAGSDSMFEVANEHKGMTHPVAQRRANGWGLYDMSGNVWEWVWEWYGDYHAGKNSDPVGPQSGSDRVCRGGAAGIPALYMRVASRVKNQPGFRFRLLGFRVARSVP